MTDLDLLVMDALEGEVPFRRDAEPDWNAVLRRAGVTRVAHDGSRPAAPSRRRGRRGRRRLTLAVLAVALLVLAGSAVALRGDLLAQQEQFHAVPDHPQARGPLVEIASREDWALIAWQSEAGLCLDFAIPGNSPFGCGFPVRGAKPATDSSGSGPPTHAVAGFVSGGGLVGGDGKTTMFGVAAREVAAVEVELADGRRVEAPIYDAPAELQAEARFFIVRRVLPPQGIDQREGPVRAWLAYDDDGRLIERHED